MAGVEQYVVRSTQNLPTHQDAESGSWKQAELFSPHRVCPVGWQSESTGGMALCTAEQRGAAGPWIPTWALGRMPGGTNAQVLPQ